MNTRKSDRSASPIAMHLDIQDATFILDLLNVELDTMTDPSLTERGDSLQYIRQQLNLTLRVRSA